MAHNRVNNITTGAAGGLGLGSIYDRVLASLNSIKLEILATTESIRGFLVSRFAVDGQFTNNFVSRLRLSFPLMSGIVIGMFLSEIRNGHAITREQLTLFNGIPIAAIVGRNLKAIDRCGNVANITLIPSPCGSNFFININSCNSISANAFIFLEVYPERLNVENVVATERAVAAERGLPSLSSASGAFASGAFASGALASGAFASGTLNSATLNERMYLGGTSSLSSTFVPTAATFTDTRRCKCCSDSDY